MRNIIEKKENPITKYSREELNQMVSKFIEKGGKSMSILDYVEKNVTIQV